MSAAPHDARCQLKLEGFDGIQRGSSPDPVYEPSRLVAATPTRLGVDAVGVAAWRELGFEPVLPEGAQRDARSSLLLRSIAVGRRHPLCRGQVALDVIDDRFFVFFVDPDSAWLQQEATFLASSRLDQQMPASDGSNALPSMWFGYGDKRADYARKKAAYIEQATRDGRGIRRESVWDGDGKNDNAALTVFRHFDSATVVKGLVGPPARQWSRTGTEASTAIAECASNASYSVRSRTPASVIPTATRRRTPTTG